MRYLSDGLAPANSIDQGAAGQVDCDHAITVIYAIPIKFGKWPTGDYDQWRMCQCGQVRMPEAVYQNRVPRD